MTALGRLTRVRAALLVAAALLGGPLTLWAPDHIPWTDEERPIFQQWHTLLALNDSERAQATSQLARRIRQLPAALHKLALAELVAGTATVGDLGQDALQEVAVTLAQALREMHERPAEEKLVHPEGTYELLAKFVRYEHVQISSDDPQFAAAMNKLEADDQRRLSANFTLTDLTGKSWSLRELRGKVVLVNFWATSSAFCPQEMPDLEALDRRFGPLGLIILGITDEDAAKVAPFVAEHRFSYPILLDADGKVRETFAVDGVPRSFVYDREGRLVAQAIGPRTQRQFLAMLAQAGLE
ncbi:MAG: TlpA disulfide reductase family protein [Bryobacteraceae bacterium]|jgi:peroxiredoxin